MKDNKGLSIVGSSRSNGEKMKNSGMIAYAWYVWDKDYKGKPTIEWIR